VWPVFKEPPRDSFPHSDYPMFSHRRPTVMQVEHALGMYDDLSAIPLSPMISSANREVLQAAVTIQRAIHGGAERRAALCAQIAERVAGDDDLSAITHVALATSRFDIVTYFDDPTPLRREFHHRCRVHRDGEP